MAVAAIGVFLAYTDAARGPAEEVVVAARPLHVGAVIDADDLRIVPTGLPTALLGRAFGDVDALIGRTVLGPVAADEIVQRGLVTDDVGAIGSHEVALMLPVAHVAVGRLKEGERVDVFATDDERTRSVVLGAQVVQIVEEGRGSLTASRDLSLVVAVPSRDEVAALVHALRRGEVTVVRSTFADRGASGDIVEFADETPGLEDSRAGSADH